MVSMDIMMMAVVGSFVVGGGIGLALAASVFWLTDRTTTAQRE